MLHAKLAANVNILQRSFSHPQVGGCFDLDVLPAALGLGGVPFSASRWASLKTKLILHHGPPRRHGHPQPPRQRRPHRGQRAPAQAGPAGQAASRRYNSMRIMIYRCKLTIASLQKRLKAAKSEIASIKAAGKTGRKLSKFSVRGGLPSNHYKTTKHTHN